jgi:hypothetical protein
MRTAPLPLLFSGTLAAATAFSVATPPRSVPVAQAPKVLLRFGLVTGVPVQYTLRDERAGRELVMYAKEIIADSSSVRVVTTQVDSTVFIVSGGRAPRTEGSIPDFVVRVNDRRQWVDSASGEDTILAGLRAIALGRAVPLPEGPVGVGDSWKVEFPTRISYHPDPSNVATAKAKVKVKRIDITPTDTTVLLDISIHLQGSQPPTNGWPVVDVSGDVSGEEVFSVHSGTTLHLKLQGRAEWSWRIMGPRGFQDRTYSATLSLFRDVGP